jgi:hypothetical protein
VSLSLFRFGGCRSRSRSLCTSGNCWRFQRGDCCTGTTRDDAAAFFPIGHQEAPFPRRSCCWPPKIPIDQHFYFGPVTQPSIHPAAFSGELFLSYHSRATPAAQKGASSASSGYGETRKCPQKRPWSDNTFVDFEHSLATAVKKLRRALGDSAAHSQFIETLPRRGYRFIATWEAEPRAGKPIVVVLPFENLTRRGIVCFPGGATIPRAGTWKRRRG